MRIFYTFFIDKDSTGGITNSEVFVADTLGSYHTLLTNRIWNYGALDISRDGETLTCHYFLGNKADICQMNIDGSRIGQLTSDTLDNCWPRWTPDGRYLGYTRVADQTDISIMRVCVREKHACVVSPKWDEILEFRPLEKHNRGEIRQE